MLLIRNFTFLKESLIGSRTCASLEIKFLPLLYWMDGVKLKLSSASEMELCCRENSDALCRTDANVV